jgi:hypothetical protein
MRGAAAQIVVRAALRFSGVALATPTVPRLSHSQHSSDFSIITWTASPRIPLLQRNDRFYSSASSLTISSRFYYLGLELSLYGHWARQLQDRHRRQPPTRHLVSCFCALPISPRRWNCTIDTWITALREHIKCSKESQHSLALALPNLNSLRILTAYSSLQLEYVRHQLHPTSRRGGWLLSVYWEFQWHPHSRDEVSLTSVESCSLMCSCLVH